MNADVVAHADWSANSSKRWMATATHDGHGYRIGPAEPVGQPQTLVSRCRAKARSAGTVLIGFDFPIGVPLAYARVAGIDNLLDWLPQLGHGQWSRFFDLAETADQVSIHRPYYPRTPGGTSQRHLVEGLGVESMAALLRECERRRPHRDAASSLFWTLGAKQVGRAAISGWRDVLLPTLHNFGTEAGIWPFHGDLGHLLDTKRIVLAETYPAEACFHLKIPLRSGSKRNQTDRRKWGELIFRWKAERPVVMEKTLVDQIIDGLGSKKGGEDLFDAVVGLCSMLDVVMGYRSDGAPDDEPIRSIEGWITGQSS